MTLKVTKCQIVVAVFPEEASKSDAFAVIYDSHCSIMALFVCDRKWEFGDESEECVKVFKCV